LPENATGIGGGTGMGGGGGTCGGQLISFIVQLRRVGAGSNHKIVGHCVTQVPHVKRFRARRTTRIQNFGSDLGCVLINAQIGCPLPAGKRPHLLSVSISACGPEANIGPLGLCQKIAWLPLTASGQDFEMKRCAFIALGDDVPPAARVQQPAAELQRLRQAWADIRA